MNFRHLNPQEIKLIREMGFARDAKALVGYVCDCGNSITFIWNDSLYEADKILEKFGWKFDVIDCVLSVRCPECGNEN